MLPKDPVILLSYVNTMLRDKYPSLEALCRAENADEDGLCASLRAIDYHYSKEKNQFL